MNVSDWIVASLLNGTIPANVTLPSDASSTATVEESPVVATSASMAKRGVPNVRWLARARLDSETLPEGDTSIQKVDSEESE